MKLCRITILSAVSWFVFVVPAGAETIHLKNGGSIYADHVREAGNKVEYSVGDNTFAIPRSTVSSIDTATDPIVSSSSPLPLPSPATKDELLVPEAIVSRVIRNGKVDADALREIVAAGKRGDSAAAYYIAARFERNPDVAAQYFLSAEGFLPNNAIILGHHAATLLRLSRYPEAASVAENAARLAPRTAFPYALLGYALYAQNRLRDAITAWQHAQDLQPDDQVAQLLERAQRDLAAQAAFTDDTSSHFKLRSEGKQVSAEMRQQVLRTLEQHYDDLARALDYTPHDAIPVILYTDQQFFDVTQSPSWSGAVNDGKLRIPISGITAMSPELSRVLKHELAHSFINQISHGRCPSWLHEGIAQMLEPRSSIHDGHRLSALYSTQHNLPLNQLEGSFSNFSAPQVVLGYAQSLITVEYMRDTYGMADIVRVLKRIAEGSSTEAALRTTIHSGYAQLEQEIARYLKRTYGD